MGTSGTESCEGCLRLNSNTYLHNVALKLNLVRLNRKPQDYAKLQGLNKGLGNTEVQRGNISAILFPKICIT